MPVESNAGTEITAFRWVPGFAQGLVRDLRVRWALEEIGRPYRVRLLDALNPRPAEYFEEQPFGQVPFYRDGEVELFETGAILIHLGLQDERLLPPGHAQRMRGIAWTIAALNSVEPAVVGLLNIDFFNADIPASKELRPRAVERIEGRLKRLSDALGDKEWLEGRFTIGDLMLVAVLRQLRHTDIVSKFPRIAALMERAEARPAFKRALADQLAVFREHEPEGADA